MSNLDAKTNMQNLPSGARFYRCALQINPFKYLVRHNKTTAFNNEADYNAAIVEACRRVGIQVVAKMKDFCQLLEKPLSIKAG